VADSQDVYEEDRDEVVNSYLAALSSAAGHIIPSPEVLRQLSTLEALPTERLGRPALEFSIPGAGSEALMAVFATGFFQEVSAVDRSFDATVVIDPVSGLALGGSIQASGESGEGETFDLTATFDVVAVDDPATEVVLPGLADALDPDFGIDFTSELGQFRMKLPPGWYVEEGDEATEFGPPGDTRILFEVVVQEMGPGVTAEDFVAFVIGESGEGAETTDPVEVLRDDGTWLRIEASWEDEGASQRTVAWFAVIDGVGYAFAGSDAADSFDDVVGAAEALFATFEPLGPGY
jgi:hypothetical protein